MPEFDVTIEVVSPILADLNIEQDQLGLPFFPSQRFKDLLHESAVEVKDVLTLADIEFDDSIVDEQLEVSDLYVKPPNEYQNFRAEWEYLEGEYGSLLRPTDVLSAFTTTRYQVQLIRVIDAGVKFFGRMQLKSDDDKHIQWLALAIRNLKSIRAEGERRFGRVNCSMEGEGGTDDKLIKKFLKGAPGL